ncbi:MAG: hypothetical protein HN742_28930 [Lentisphaerae bacterium]|jgi:hypothetical protein|nr:hypothetical protein [Lentisphaerota bacterium]MBT5611859.1 hypothetical protein [Lentisphaerota bacterium]MBT7056918.1 hypothetical protein [Lentisphaerota bacterium]MBT7845932.1 hypothetical protein [Lentisphaerota bacterium]
MHSRSSILLALTFTFHATLACAAAIRMDFREPYTAKFHGAGSFEKTYGCRRTETPPVINGKTDDAVWAGLQEITFGVGEARTNVRACYDDHQLYLAFTCFEKTGRETQETPRDRDSNVWRDDAIEICLGPPQLRKIRVWYHFIISAANSVYDHRMRFSRAYGQPFNPDFEHAVFRDDDHWSVEVAIPAAELDLPGWPGQMGVSVGRDGPGLGPSFWGKRRDVESSAFRFEGAGGGAARDTEDDKPFGNRPVIGDSLRVHVDRPYARPGERWIEVNCRLTPKLPLDQTTVRGQLLRVAEATPVETFTVTPTRSHGRIEVDLRRHGLEAAELVVEVLEGSKRTGAGRFALSAQTCSDPLNIGDRIAMKMDVPEDLDPALPYPVVLGVPFPAGALWDMSRTRVVDASGSPIPHQKEVTGLWAHEGSIKWMRFDALVTPSRGCFVELSAPSGDVAPDTPLRVEENGDEILVDTGASRYVLGSGPSPIRAVWLGQTEVAETADTRGLYVVDQRGRLARASSEGETVTIEARGPVTACVRLEGWYDTDDGQHLARHITRIECFAGQQAARVSHTLVLTEDTNDVWFKEAGWEFAVRPGTDASAVFNVDHRDLGRTTTIALPGNKASAHMLQDSHYHFNHGSNHFQVVSAVGGKQAPPLLEGEECGDYGILTGADAGLQLVCRNAALQHPKEFEVFSDRIVLKLFSGRAGQELDFRTETLVKKWDLATWYEQRTSNNMYANYYRTSPLDALKNYKSNAAGWARTHSLLVAPLAGRQTDRATANAKLLRTPVYVHTDPQWIYRTRAMGPNYPRDPERFPEIEQTLDAYIDWLKHASERWGEYGFVDYNGGPRFSYYEKDGKLWPEMKRFNMTYALRANLWLVYARSGDRNVRELTAGTARGHADGKMSNWDSSVSRRGLIRSSAHRDLPFDWGEANMMQNGQTGCLNIHIWDYYLTGNRRAKDMLLDYAAAAKRRWTPAVLLHPTYPAFTLLRLAQAYAFTGDRDLRDLCAASMDLIEDGEADMRVNKYAYTNADPRSKVCDIIRAYIEGWELIGETRYHDVARALGDYYFHQSLLRAVDGYVPTMGRVGAFLYDDHPTDIIAENMFTQCLRVPALRGPDDTAAAPGNLNCAALTNFLTRIGSALHVVTDSNADREPCASWVAFNDAGGDVSVCIAKPEDEPVELLYTAPGPVSGERPVQPIEPKSLYGTSLYRITTHTGRGTVRLPKDMAGYAYRFSFSGSGSTAVFADRRVPLVIHAPGYWYPEPVQRPGMRWYFRLPPDTQDAQIFFEGAAKLITPSGEPFAQGDVLTGWVDLPADEPGLWSFQLQEYKLVRARNFPPFFAVRDPQSHFVPQIGWSREPRAVAATPPPIETAYLPGAIRTKGNQALHLAGKRHFRIAPGAPRADGDGTQFLPYHEGTIEFFMKPLRWDSFTLPDPTRKRLILGSFEGGGHLNIDHSVRGREKIMDGFLHSVYHNTERDQGAMMIRSHRPNSLFERNRWAHVACVWGHRGDVGYHPRRTKFGKDVLTVRCYLNGKYLPSPANRHSGQNSKMKGFLQFLLLYASDTAIDELRISDMQRYTEDFTPPSRDQEFAIDSHTRVLCHFNGDQEILTWDPAE